MLLLLFLALGFAIPSALAHQAGSFSIVGSTLVSALMVRYYSHSQVTFSDRFQMFVGGKNKVYIIDKAEGNAAQVNGHSAYAAVW